MEPEKPNPELLKKDRDRKLTSSEDLEELMQIVGTKSWWALITTLTIILIAIIWSFLGSIPIKVAGNGISLTEEGPYVVSSQIRGVVTKVHVYPGQEVEKDSLLVQLQNASLALDIQLKKDQILQAENDLNLFKSKVEKAQEELAQPHQDIAPSPSRIEELKAQKALAYHEDERATKQAALNNTKAELARLELQSQFLKVYAGKKGKVLEVLVSPGDVLNPDTEIASIELPLEKDQHLQFIACFGAQYGESLDVNLKSEIEVSGIDPKEYGYLLGTTKFITPYPVTNEALVAKVRNKAIADYLKSENPLVYLAVISLDLDPSTPSGYRWSSGKGPPWQLDAGTTGRVLIVTEEKPPILYVLPEDVAPFLYRELSKSSR